MTESAGFVLAESVARSTVDDDIYAHLDALVAVEFSRPDSPAQSGVFKFNASKYQALEQAAFEESSRMEAAEPQPVDWSYVDGRASAFEARLTQSLSSVADSGDPSVFVEFSTKCFENWLTYDLMYPDQGRRQSNPWRRVIRIISFGRLPAIGDPSQMRRTPTRSRARIEPQPQYDDQNVVALVKAAPRTPASIHVDERFDQQAKLLSLLRSEASGHSNKMPLREMQERLKAEFDIGMSKENIQVKLTTPLKRAGVVGSNAKGFFFVESAEDLIQSYCFHLTKVTSAHRIMRRLQTRALEFDPDLNLRDECEGGGRVLNPDL